MIPAVLEEVRKQGGLNVSAAGIFFFFLFGLAYWKLGQVEGSDRLVWCIE